MKKNNENMKKMLTGVLSISMLFTTCMMGSAAEKTAETDIDNPVGVYYGVNNADGYDSTNYSIKYSENAYEGDYSLYISNTEIDYRSLITKIPFKTTLATGDTYRVSYWINCENQEGQIAMGIRGGADVKFDWVSPSATNEWVYCEKDVTLTLDANEIQFTTWKSSRYIDDVQVRKVNADGTLGENVVFNGNFETIKVRNSHTKYPVNFFGWYTNYPDEKETFFASSDADAYTGERSLMVNISDEVPNATYDVVTYMDEGLKNGTKYKFEAYIKNADIYNTRASLANQGGNISWGFIRTEGGTDAGDGWYKITYEITGDSAQDKTLRFAFWPKGTMLIDDVSLYELDSNGNVIDGAVNLIPYGDMEEYLDFESVDAERITNNNWKINVKVVDNVTAPSVEKSDYVRFEEYEPGNYAMHLNYDDYVKDNTYVSVSASSEFEIENGTEYTCEYDIKAASHDDKGIGIHPFGNWGNGCANSATAWFRNVASQDLDNGWRHCTITATSNQSSGDIRIYLDGYCDAVIDNIKVYKTSDVSKTNLVVDGDFQNSILTPAFDEQVSVGEAYGWGLEKHNLSGADENYAKLVKISEGNYAMHLNADFAQADNVYYLFTNVDDNGNAVKHIFPGSGGTYTLSFDAKGITTDTFAYGAYWEGHVIRNSQSSEWIKTELGDGWVNYRFTQNWGTGSDGRELQPAINVDKPVDFIVDNISFRDDVTGVEYIINGDFNTLKNPDPIFTTVFKDASGNKADKLAVGAMSVSCTVENLDKPVAAFLAVYEDGKLYEVSIMTASEKTSGLYETGFIVPDLSGESVFTAKVMFWNDIAGIVPYCPAALISE
ncbi:MAG: hypothetical protein J6N52_03875 [Clostridia bacterium]|nr:hypothetical protein [Clostridia bacterium]